jgi:anti-sigma regulatory factor (Ser/Thr protein kinase)
MKTFPIKLPAEISSTNIDLLINTIFQDFTNKKVLLDFTYAKWLEPICLALVAFSVFHFHNKDIPVRYKRPSNNNLQQYLDSCRFTKIINVKKNTDIEELETNIPLRHFKLNSLLDYAYIERIMNLIKHEVSLEPEIERILRTSIAELFTNVNDHSRSKLGCFSLAQWYPRKKKVCLTVLDNGIGFLKSLQQVYPDLSSEKEAILCSIEEKTSSKSTDRNAGMGLYTIKLMIEAGSGKLDIISGNTQVTFNSDGTLNIKNWTNSFPGSIINIELEPTLKNLGIFADTTHREEEDWF